MMTAIRLHELHKSYGSREVLRGLNLEIRRGEIFALLGVNGAGKTTTLECIEGLRPYDRGQIEVHGRLGIQLQSASLPPLLKAGEALKFLAKLQGVRPELSCGEVLGLKDFAGSCYRDLSTGQKRRLHLALALLSDPDILILDEPTAGLDVTGRLALHDLIRQLRADGKTILLASHDMAEVESLADRLAILRDGVIAFCGTAGELGRTLGRQFNIRLKTTAGTRELSTGAIAAALPALLQEVQAEGQEILDIKIDRGNLEQHFMEMTGRYSSCRH